MKKMKLYILFFFVGICFLQTGCQPHSTILFIYKNYSYEYIESYPEIGKKINKNCKKNGYEPEFAIVNREGEQSISDIITKTKASLIYIDPFVKESPESLAEILPDTLFFSLKRNSNNKKPPNLLSIYFNRRDIFKHAGIMTGKLLMNLKNAKIKAIERDMEFKAGMIIYPASPDAELETSEYLSGFSEVCPENLFIYHELNNTTDKVVIQNILDDMKNKGVVIFFFKVYSLNTYCLDYVKKEGGYSIVENWNNTGEYDDIFLFSIVDDFPMTLLNVFNNVKSKKELPLEWEKQEIDGVVNIVWGKTLEPLE